MNGSMLGSLANILKVPDLRRKLTITVLLLLVYRIGAHVPCPFTDATRLEDMFAKGGRGMLDMVDMFSGGAFKQMTIFALGIMPNITASIILQLLTVVIPQLEKIAKEGEAGRKKINQYTRYGTVILTAFQSVGLAIMMIRMGVKIEGVSNLLFIFTTMVAMTTGTCFIMWLGEKITEFGIGNGISLIIAAGIMARYPSDIKAGYSQALVGNMPWIGFIAVPVIFVAVTALIILVQQASRKIPIQYARRLVGRREMQGGANYLPLKINTAGVIPVIFASSILMFPSMFINLFSSETREGLAPLLQDFFSQATTQYNLYAMLDIQRGGIFSLLKMGNFHNLAYVFLTVFFCYFYTAITFNPVDTADNLKRVGAFIPGRRPGKNTSDYIDYVLSRITCVGATFLVVVAMLPDVLTYSFGINAYYAQMVGGTGLIIVAGVMLDLMKQIESQLLMRHYEGFKYRSRTSGAANYRTRVRHTPETPAATRSESERS